MDDEVVVFFVEDVALVVGADCGVGAFGAEAGLAGGGLAAVDAWEAWGADADDEVFGFVLGVFVEGVGEDWGAGLGDLAGVIIKRDGDAVGEAGAEG